MHRRSFLGSLLAGTTTVAGATKPRPASRTSPTDAHDTENSVPDEGAGPRIRRNFNNNWLFKRQTIGAGELGSMDRQNGRAALVEPEFRRAHNPEYDDSSWERVTLPHTWNAHDTTDAAPGYWRGIGWYRKHFTLDRNFSGKRIFLEFEGVNSVSEFWLNGQRIGKHKGGYTGFEFDITDLARLGPETNLLTVKVDNLYHPNIPPTVKSDYNFYGGIYRYAWLRVSKSAYIKDVYWTTPEVSDESAEVRIETQIANKGSQPRNLTLRQEIFSPDNVLVKALSTSVAVSASQIQTVGQSSGPINHPQLWAPDTPHLYRIVVSLLETGRRIDQVEVPLGFRWYRFDPQKGLIFNGRRLQIQGTNWHQVYPGMGNALPKSRHWEDMKMIREMGANFWRTSHYPHDSATLEASDQLGLMVWEELPVNKEIGQVNEYIPNVFRMAEEMIRRDRNHPSIIVWGLAGEVNAPLKTAKEVVGAVTRKYRQLDPTRPVAMHYPGSEEIEALVDVVGLGVGEEADARHIKYPGRSYMTAEYSASKMGRGIYGFGPESEDLACVEHEKYLGELNSRPWMAGGAIWHQFDYDGESYDIVVPHIVAFGMTDVWRIPKDVYYFYQSQWSTSPVVHIVGHWTWPGEDGKTRGVKVYSNSPEVELFINGKSLGTQRDERRNSLLHAPRIWSVPYQPGILKAVARGKGYDLADERQTSCPPHRIVLQSDIHELNSGDPESLAYITALVADDKGNVVPDARNAITFTLYGPGELLEQTWLGHGTGWTWNAVAGKTRIAFRANSRSGNAVISAYSPGLRMGRLDIKVVGPGKPDEMDYID